MTDEEIFDVIVVGAGISGLYAAYRIKQRAPHLKVLVLEAKGQYQRSRNKYEYPSLSRLCRSRRWTHIDH